ncbi:uncharacterized protein LOC123379049 [Felis catus]|uniref:uncharacterized protein LOC123379049 n=1 Tax=Felis catus TaxID=9685 RepID=UPI001D19EB65|nr:uncharacterized protein LOC123379049 [Felis catus]
MQRKAPKDSGLVSKQVLLPTELMGLTAFFLALGVRRNSGTQKRLLTPDFPLADDQIESALTTCRKCQTRVISAVKGNNKNAFHLSCREDVVRIHTGCLDQHLLCSSTQDAGEESTRIVTTENLHGSNHHSLQ